MENFPPALLIWVSSKIGHSTGALFSRRSSQKQLGAVAPVPPIGSSLVLLPAWTSVFLQVSGFAHCRPQWGRADSQNGPRALPPWLPAEVSQSWLAAVQWFPYSPVLPFLRITVQQCVYVRRLGMKTGTDFKKAQNTMQQQKLNCERMSKYAQCL